MSERTAASLAKFDEFYPVMKSLGTGPAHERLADDADALRRAIASFHMEAIRFRMHNVDRALKETGENEAARAAFEQLRQALEAAGFHTRSQAAP